MLAQVLAIHADEPLRRCAEDDGRLVPPAVRVAVTIRLVMDQAAALFQQLDDHRIRFLHFEPRDKLRIRKEAAIVTDRIRDGQFVPPAHREVLMTVSRRRVNGTRSRVERHVLAENHRHIPLVERMA
jgi:hypothetical protein